MDRPASTFILPVSAQRVPEYINELLVRSQLLAFSEVTTTNVVPNIWSGDAPNLVTGLIESYLPPAP